MITTIKINTLVMNATIPLTMRLDFNLKPLRNAVAVANAKPTLYTKTLNGPFCVGIYFFKRSPKLI